MSAVITETEIKTVESIENITAREINDLLEDIKIKEVDITKSSMSIGEKLCAVKKSLPHGQFIPWLKEHVNMTRSQASRYMRVHKRFDSNVELTQHFSFTHLCELVKLSDEEIAALGALEELSALSVKELKSLMSDKNKSDKLSTTTPPCPEEDTTITEKQEEVEELEAEIELMEARRREMSRKIRDIEEEYDNLEQLTLLSDILWETCEVDPLLTTLIEDTGSIAEGVKKFLSSAYSWEQVRRYLFLTRKIQLPESPPKELRTIVKLE